MSGHTKLAEFLLAEEARKGLINLDEARGIKLAIERAKISKLHALCTKGSAGATVRLLKSQAGPNDIDAKSGKLLRTALHCAASSASEQIVMGLLEKSANLMVADSNGDIPLMLACRWGHLKVAMILTNHGGRAAIAAKNARGLSARQIAEANGHRSVAENLLRAEVGHGLHEPAAAAAAARTVVLVDREHGLRQAARRGLHQEIAKLLGVGDPDQPSSSAAYSVPPRINACDEEGFTALHHAAASGSLRAMKLLLTHRANVNARGYDGDTPLILAARLDKRNVVAELLQSGAGPLGLRGSDGKTARQSAPLGATQFLLFAAEERQGSLSDTEKAEYRRGMEVMLRHHAINNAILDLRALFSQCIPEGTMPDVNAIHPRVGKSALHYAVARDFGAVVNELLKMKADTELRDPSGSTPLIIAATHDSLSAALALINHGANLQATRCAPASLRAPAEPEEQQDQAPSDSVDDGFRLPGPVDAGDEFPSNSADHQGEAGHSQELTVKCDANDDGGDEDEGSFDGYADDEDYDEDDFDEEEEEEEVEEKGPPLTARQWAARLCNSRVERAIMWAERKEGATETLFRDAEDLHLLFPEILGLAQLMPRHGAPRAWGEADYDEQPEDDEDLDSARSSKMNYMELQK